QQPTPALLTFRTRSVAVASRAFGLFINEVLPRRVPEDVGRSVLPVDQHIGILAPQQRLPHLRRPEAQIEIAVAYRQLRAGSLVDRPEKRRADSRGLQRAPVDHHDPDSRNRLSAVFAVTRILRSERL